VVAAISSTRQYHKGNVAEDLKAVAARILETERVEDLSVRRLTREVGVTPANFYNHFPNLDDLLLNMAAESFRKRARYLEHIRRTSKTKAEAIKRGMTSYVEIALTEPQMFRIMFGYFPDAQQHPAFRAAADESFGGFAELVYGEPVFDPVDIPKSHERCKVAYGLWAMGYGLARIVVEGHLTFTGERRTQIRQFVESVVDAFIERELDGLLV
jgi:AcrR family transcriptional regulator